MPRGEFCLFVLQFLLEYLCSFRSHTLCIWVSPKAKDVMKLLPTLPPTRQKGLDLFLRVRHQIVTTVRSLRNSVLHVRFSTGYIDSKGLNDVVLFTVFSGNGDASQDSTYPPYGQPQSHNVSSLCALVR